MIVTVTLVLGIVTVARTIGPAFQYRLHWAPLIAMLAMVVAVVGWVEDHRTVHHESRVPHPVVPEPVDARRVRRRQRGRRDPAGTPQRTRSETVSKLAESGLLTSLPVGRGDVLVRSYDPITGYQAGLVLWLERRGVVDQVGTDRVDLLRREIASHHNDQPLRAVITVVSTFTSTN